VPSPGFEPCVELHSHSNCEPLGKTTKDSDNPISLVEDSVFLETQYKLRYSYTYKHSPL
jgi:hypothetical protein